MVEEEATTQDETKKKAGNERLERLRYLNHGEIVFAGAAAGFIGRVIIQPLDVIKTRFQLQVEPIRKGQTGAKYTSMLQATSTIFREEGVTAFWKGHTAAQLLSVTFGVVQFWTFQQLVKLSKTHNLYDNHKGSINFISGAIAGAFSSIATFPFDIMRTRQIAQSKKVYGNMLQGYRHMIKNEGILSLYKGLSPTLLSIMPNAGLQFMIYKFIDRQYKRLLGVHDENAYSITGSIIAGSMAGLGSKLAVYPLDLTRKRMQIQGFQKYRTTFGEQFTCHNMINCTIKTFRKEGLAGLFKGCVPSMWKAVLTSGINFAVFEAVCDTIAKWKEIQRLENQVTVLKHLSPTFRNVTKYGVSPDIHSKVAENPDPHESEIQEPPDDY